MIRVAVDDDLDDLTDLAARTFPLACPPGMPEEDMAAFIAQHLSAETFAHHLADPAAEVLVADDAGALRGYTLTVAGEPYGVHAGIVRRRPSIELSKCYVDPAAHGLGTAAALMAEVLRRAAASGAASVWLGVNAQNDRAQRFYARSGFAVVGERTFVVGSRTEQDLVLECPM